MVDRNYSPSKRKRDTPPTSPESSPSKTFVPATPSPMRLSTNIPGAFVSVDDAPHGSPRTKVAYNFQGLRLDGGDEISKFDLRKEYDTNERMDFQRDDAAIRKRMKLLNGGEQEQEKEIPETPRAFTISIGRERTVDPIIPEKANQIVLHNDLDPVIFKGSAHRVERAALPRTYPSVNRLAESSSRIPPKKRMGTPPLFGAADASLAPEASTIVDPDRAALTWHDDEITGHNPNDPEDDGEGINGIGFKPTAAIAYARTAKRRQQMEAYKSREAKEAREKRSERRRANEAASQATSREEAETARRVRFLEAEIKSIISIP
ncbi:hypothetical protein BP6252_05342 [Coleophoma cylindrospora]|uniref:Uncharacterized protein n=1 Tax=Coleophoma cylindrospora TaxID=1849047 RepID=A0A3D8RTC2_9HELO|nr:hypothetical protein BP6252_05342 [Coleophoma cylindrospora]